MIGAGWIGRAVAGSLGTDAVARRSLEQCTVPAGARVVVASGRASLAAGEGLTESLRAEMAHLRLVLDAAERADAERIVVLGSSDVAGMAPVIDGTTAQDPRTAYAEVKAALEDECVQRRAGGSPVTCVRLAPVHGPGKARTATLLKLATLPLVPLPNGGTHSCGFILLDDAVRAVEWLLDNPAPAVQSVGAGHTPLRALLQSLGKAQGRRFRAVAIPVPARTTAGVIGARGPVALQWAVRLACPRAVLMDPPVESTPLAMAAQRLVHSC